MQTWACCQLHDQDHRAISPAEIRSLAKNTAVQAVESQKVEFRELGIMADWDGAGSTYRTLGTPMLSGPREQPRI
jgi:isoleucyl-tRNA synthetase